MEAQRRAAFEQSPFGWVDSKLKGAGDAIKRWSQRRQPKTEVGNLPFSSVSPVELIPMMALEGARTINRWGYGTKDPGMLRPEDTLAPSGAGVMAAPFHALGAGRNAVGVAGGKLSKQASQPLDMSESARMARAKEQGYTLDAYHGTNSAFDEFKRIDGGNARGDGFYFTPDAASAGRYAMGDTNRITPQGNAGPNVIPVKLRGDNLFDENALVDKKTRVKLAEVFNERVRKQAAAEGREPYPDELMDPKEFGSTWFDRAYEPRGYNVLQSLTYDADEANDLLRAIGLRGRIGTSVGRNTTGGDIVMFDPKDIRSRYAAFDPANADSAKLLGANPGTEQILDILRAQQQLQGPFQEE